MTRAADPLAGAALFEDVRAYDALGEHRTATPGDHATSLWLKDRFESFGMTASLNAFDAPLFTPDRCEIGVDGAVLDGFPAWPAVTTPYAGLRAPLAPGDAPLLAGKIAVVRLAYGRAASWAAPHLGGVVFDAITRGAIAVIAVTEGPTGEIIALNAEAEHFDWLVPVVIAGGRDVETLSRAAALGAEAVLVSTGTRTPDAQASNVIGRRAGQGATLVVSTPKSGWFHCAGERGSGIAVFLALAHWLTRNTAADLLFVASTGHELAESGGAHFLKTAAPPPSQVKFWLHIGANVALQKQSIEIGKATPNGQAIGTRGVIVMPDLDAAARQVFAGLAGYEQPQPFPEVAPGELERFRRAGYAPLAGMIGFNPLFHTRLDRADVATTPEILESVARAAVDFVRGFA
jgi:hypothetical protein